MGDEENWQSWKICCPFTFLHFRIFVFAFSLVPIILRIQQIVWLNNLQGLSFFP
jgi:hypothetical protein